MAASLPTKDRSWSHEGWGSSHRRKSRPAPQPVVVVAAPQLKKALELQLLQQQLPKPLAGDGGAPRKSHASEGESPPRQQQLNGGMSRRGPLCSIGAAHMLRKNTVKSIAERYEASDTKPDAGSVLQAGGPVEPSLSPQQESQLMGRGAEEGNTASEQQDDRMIPVEEKAERGLDENRQPFAENDNAETVPCGGATSAHDGELQLVRISRRAKENRGTDECGCSEDPRGPRDAGSFRRHNVPSYPRAADESSDALFQSAKGAAKTLQSACQQACLLPVQRSSTAFPVRRQWQCRDSCCWMHTSAANGDTACSSSSSCIGPPESNVRAFVGMKLEWNRKKASPASAVRALEEEQQREENRLLLLEVSQHAIEKQAESRRREQEIQRQLVKQQLRLRLQRQQTLETTLAEHSRNEENQQEPEGLSPVQQPAAAEDCPAFQPATGVVCASARQAVRRGLPPQNPQQRRREPRQQQQVNQGSKTSHRGPAFVPLCSSPVAITQASACTLSRQPAFNAAPPSAASTTKPSHMPNRIVGALTPGTQIVRQKQQLYGGLRDQHQALLGRLLDEYIRDNRNSAAAEDGKGAAAPAAAPDSSTVGPQARQDSHLLARSMERSDLLRALQRLLLMPVQATLGAAVSTERPHTRGGGKLPQQQQQMQVERGPSAGCAPAGSRGAAPRQSRRSLFRASSSYSRHTPLPPLRSETEPVAKHHGKHLQQQVIAQTDSSASSPHDMTSGHRGRDTESAQTQELREQQLLAAAAIVGPLLTGMMLHNQALQKQDWQDRQQPRQEEDQEFGADRMESVRRSSKSMSSKARRTASGVAQGRPPSLPRA